MEFALQAIGTIHTPFTDKDKMPIQASRSQAIGHVDVNAEFADGLADIEGFSHLILLYIFHRSSGYTLQVKPFLDDVLHGVFSTRYPRRPNPIGLSIVRLISRRANVLEVEGADMLEGTPLLDIKPYIPEFDVREVTAIGWYSSHRFTQGSGNSGHV